MKKKTVIIISTVLFTLILGLVLVWRIYLISLDKSGVYLLPTENFFNFFMNYLPELTIGVTIVAIYAKRKLGLIFSVSALVMSILSLGVEIIIFTLRSLDYASTVPTACLPWLDVPGILICVILFLIKFKIYTLPRTIKFKK